MAFRTSSSLRPDEVKSALRYVTKDGIFTESMVALTGGAFLVAMAIQLGASNFQIGLLAALPTLSNLFQLVSIWLVQRYNNRRAISTTCSFLARFPLLVIGILPLFFSAALTVNMLIFFLFFHYVFGSVSGASWNSWMKDLIPEKKLGSYFSFRTRITQLTNVLLSVVAALALDYIRKYYPGYEVVSYPVMFLLGGLAGMAGVYMLARTPEPHSAHEAGKILKLIRKPVADGNFRKLLFFQSAWAFSLNLVTPFFTVYLLEALKMPLATVIVLSIVSQLSGVAMVRIWGKYTDRFSNKTIIRICAPLYISSLIGWTMIGDHLFTVPLLVLIHILSGISIAGVNLATTNLGLKLAPAREAIVYIVVRNMTCAFIPAIAPILGGIFADSFATAYPAAFLSFDIPVNGESVVLFQWTTWSSFFVLAALLAIFSLRFLRQIREDGEADKGQVLDHLYTYVRRRFVRARGSILMRLVPGAIIRRDNPGR